MNDKLTPEEKLRIIDLLTVSQSKEELRLAINKYLSSPQEDFSKEVLPPKEEIEVVKENNQDKDLSSNSENNLSSTPGKASIYDLKYRELVKQDQEKHPRDEVLTMDIPVDQPNELASTFDKELSSLKEEVKEEENTTQEEVPYYPEEPKVLEKKLNNPWADSGARTVSPGELNL